MGYSSTSQQPPQYSHQTHRYWDTPHTHTHTHTLQHTHIYTHTQPSHCPPERMYWGMWGCPRQQIPSSPIPQRALCLQQSVYSEWQESTLLQDNTHSNPSIGHTAIEQSLMVEGWERWYKSGTSLFLLLGCDQTSQEKMARFAGGGTHVNLLCHLLPSSSPPVSTPPPTPYPLPVKVWMRLKAAMWLPAVTESLSDCPPVCLSVCLSVCSFVHFVCVALWGPQLRTELSCCEACWEDVEPPQLWHCGFSERTKKRWQKRF